jgi:hypothetical protein
VDASAKARAALSRAEVLAGLSATAHAADVLSEAAECGSCAVDLESAGTVQPLRNVLCQCGEVTVLCCECDGRRHACGSARCRRLVLAVPLFSMRGASLFVRELAPYEFVTGSHNAWA